MSETTATNGHAKAFPGWRAGKIGLSAASLDARAIARAMEKGRLAGVYVIARALGVRNGKMRERAVELGVRLVDGESATGAVVPTASFADLDLAVPGWRAKFAAHHALAPLVADAEPAFLPFDEAAVVYAAAGFKKAGVTLKQKRYLDALGAVYRPGGYLVDHVVGFDRAKVGADVAARLEARPLPGEVELGELAGKARVKKEIVDDLLRRAGVAMRAVAVPTFSRPVVMVPEKRAFAVVMGALSAAQDRMLRPESSVVGADAGPPLTRDQVLDWLRSRDKAALVAKAGDDRVSMVALVAREAVDRLDTWDRRFADEMDGDRDWTRAELRAEMAGLVEEAERLATLSKSLGGRNAELFRQVAALESELERAVAGRRLAEHAMAGKDDHAADLQARLDETRATLDEMAKGMEAEFARANAEKAALLERAEVAEAGKQGLQEEVDFLRVEGDRKAEGWRASMERGSAGARDFERATTELALVRAELAAERAKGFFARLRGK